jgi:MYXO-CTERM domain-containing protein
MQMQNRSKFIAAALAATALVTGGLGASTAHADSILTGNFGVDNYGFVYISTSATSLGTLIGSTATWNPAEALAATRLFGGTTYYLNVEAINGDPGTAHNSGAFIGDFSLSGGGTFSNGTTHLLTGTAGWLGSYNDANYTDTAQAWVAPTGSVTDEGLNGISPYGAISGISGSADFIWATDSESGPANGNQCAACTVDYQTVITTAVPEPSSWTVMLMGLAGLAGALVLRRGKAADIG